MTKDEILQIAGECGFDLHWHSDGKLNINMGQLEHFAAAAYAKGAEDMRERAKVIAYSVNNHDNPMTAQDVGDSIAALPITTNTKGEQ